MVAEVSRPTSTSSFRIALANLRFPSAAEESVQLALGAIRSAAEAGAQLVCFPECYVPGYRRPGTAPPPGDAAFLERAWQTLAKAARAERIAVVLGTERVVEGGVMASVLVIDGQGERLGFQDKVQIDPSEEGIYVPGAGRRVFEISGLKFGVAICHEGFRYPETVRWAAQRGAQVVFHPQVHEAEDGAYQPATFADPAGSFHEKSALCRAAENTVYFATVNVASAGSPTTSAVVRPDGTLLSYQPYGVEGLLIADLDLTTATGLLASRFKAVAEA
jgi:predicted amidohydrolase